MKEEFRKKLFEEHDSRAEAKYIENRLQKAWKIKEVLRDFGRYSGDLLDIGCSLGIISGHLSKDYKVTGIDVDEQAISYARAKWAEADFLVKSGDDTGFDGCSFDIVLCVGVYEHVDDAEKLLGEIFRILRPGGICYFTAMNRFIPVEPHYHLPFLSYFPRPLSSLYLNVVKGKAYDVKAFSLWRLKKLVSDFKVFDYTPKVVKDPEAFHALDVVSPDSIKQKVALFVVKHLYFMVPTYIWVLKKEG